MDSPNLCSPKIISKLTRTKMGTPFEDIEKASVESKIKEALGKYNVTEKLRESRAETMVARQETLHLHPPTIAGAMILMEWSARNGIEYPRIFNPIPYNQKDTERGFIDQVSRIRKNQVDRLNQIRKAQVDRVIAEIIPTNMSEPKLSRIKRRTQADLLRYMLFIEVKVKPLFRSLNS